MKFILHWDLRVILLLTWLILILGLILGCEPTVKCKLGQYRILNKCYGPGGD